MLKGAWIARESSKEWPLPIDSDDETNETDNISGENLFDFKKEEKKSFKFI